MSTSANNFAKQSRLFDSDEATDVVLMVDALGQGESYEWDNTRIRDVLIIEAGVNPQVAEAIAYEVEEQLLEHGRERVSTALIRELVNVKLFERGLDTKLTDHRRIGLPLHDFENMLFHKNRENSVAGYNPESVNHAVAETVIKEYALSKIFSPDVADAHLKGDIHLHDLGMATRPYAALQSVAYVARNGLQLPGVTFRATPAKHADVLLAHLVKMTMLLQNSFAGAIAWDAVNVVFAPYLEGMTDSEIRQLAQNMLFEFDRMASGRGNVVFTSFDLYCEIPKQLKSLPAIGPGGKFTGKNYEAYAAESEKFLRAILEIYKEGCSGQPFFFPKALLHITRESFEQNRDLLLLACDTAAEKGSVQFVFDKDCVTLGECYSAPEEYQTAYGLRKAAMQNVTINLPRAAYKANASVDSLLEILYAELEIAAKAHIQKRDFIKKLLAFGKEGPLGTLLLSTDGEPFFKLDDSIYLIGLLGMNEAIQAMTGSELHESKQCLELALDITQKLAEKCNDLCYKYNLKFVLEQTPAESTSLRFAKLDLKQFKDKAEQFVKGSLDTGAVYYTNSTHLCVAAELSAFDKILREGKFHNFFAGAVTYLYTGSLRPQADALLSLLERAFFETDARQLALSPTFTVCNECGYITRGLTDYCLSCEGEDIDGIAKIAGSYSYISSWNAGKLAELKDRKALGTL